MTNVQATDVANTIRRLVTRFFVESRDFNGIPIQTVVESSGLAHDEVVAALADLARTGDVTVVTSSAFVNPHIKPWSVAVDQQLEGLAKDDLTSACVYPSSELVRAATDLSRYDERPFTRRLALAEGQLEPVYFDLSVLESYQADPRYTFTFHDYAGSIGLTYKFHGSSDVEPSDDSFLQTFGLGYDDRDERVVVAHLRYLHGLSPEHQQIWNAKLVKRPCKMVYEYFQNGILAEWAEDMSFYAAVLLEMRIINEIAVAVGRPPLFRTSFEDEAPKEFSLFFRPTLRNFEAFVHVLDKMLSENIDKAFFMGDVDDEERITRNDGTIEVRVRGTLAMLDDWLRNKWKVTEAGFPANIMDPLREVRDQRQRPAHKIVPDEYDKRYAIKQDELVERVYFGLRLLRLLLQNYPQSKTVKVPEELQKGRIKRF